MPAVLRVGPYRFYFYSHDLINEPPHGHVDHAEQSAKVWLKPVALARNLGFNASELRRLERRYERINRRCRKGGTRNMDVHPGERVKDVRCTKDTLRVDLMDGRTIIVPLAWYPRLLHATGQERANWKVAGGGYGIHWPDIDEDLSVEGLLRGLPGPRAGTSVAGKTA